MTMVAVLGNAVHLAQCSMLRASPDATGRCFRVSVCDILPGRLPWSLMLPVDAYKTQLLAYLLHRNPIVVFCSGMKKSDLDDIGKNVQYSM